MTLLSLEKEGELAAQAHFALAGLYRKQGKTAEADAQMRDRNPSLGRGKAAMIREHWHRKERN